MIVLFWGLTLLLSFIALGFLIPWLKINLKSLVIFSFILLFSYGFYFIWGASQYLAGYYSETDQKNRTQMQRFRPLMAELKKQEFRLRFHLEENPKDILAQSHLLELLSIQAMQAGDQTLAKQFLIKALELLSASQEYKERRAHIQELLKQNF